MARTRHDLQLTAMPLEDTRIGRTMTLLFTRGRHETSSSVRMGKRKHDPTELTFIRDNTHVTTHGKIPRGEEDHLENASLLYIFN